MKAIYLLLLPCLIGTIQAQTIQKLDVKNLPQGIKYEGSIKDAVRFTDSQGEHIIITTETGIFRNKKYKDDDFGRDAALYAYNYTVKNDTITQVWKVYDYITDCPVDIEASFIKNTFQITDLDKDGVSEVWLMYKTACHGDVSPCEMKIIMYEGKQKFAMRGQNKVFGGTDDDGVKYYIGGEYTFDSAFTNSPETFREFAKALWEKNIMQKWGEK